MERFLARLQDNVVVEGIEDKVCWVDTKSGTFSVKSLHVGLETRRVVPYSHLVLCGMRRFLLSVLFCLGGDLGKSFNS